VWFICGLFISADKGHDIQTPPAVNIFFGKLKDFFGGILKNRAKAGEIFCRPSQKSPCNLRAAC
jgi:hypothetical protein